MRKIVLLDLDSTLLQVDMDQFLKHYLGRLQAFAPPEWRAALIPNLLASTQLMIADDDATRLCADVFWDDFSQRMGEKREHLEPYFDRFYREDYVALAELVQEKEATPRLLRWLGDNDYSIVIATNPLFPPLAIEHRLVWAGAAMSDYDYLRVTHYENSHASKPHPAYYVEILAQVGYQPSDAVMVGDDWGNDMLPAMSLGMATYWITSEGGNEVPDEEKRPDGQGSLAEFLALCQDGWLERI
ncbi:MAG TPA: HAD family hydrolase [Anaerolineae bacterium]|nr:HAD family hydrolase [Anaerolineae bacterium]